MRQRKRDWPQTVVCYHVTEATIPESMWAQARKMQALWNRLCEMHAAVRASITDVTPEDERKAKWAQFNLDARAAAKASGLHQECDADILERFTKACVAAAKDYTRGWPRPKGLSVSIRHRYSGGGCPVSSLSSSRSSRCRFSERLDVSRFKRRCLTGVFGLNDGSQIEFTATATQVIPPGSIVKSARWVGRYSRAFGWRWRIAVQVETPPVQQRTMTGKTCAIDVGWRKLEGALRVGYLVDSTGERRELRLPLDFSTRDTRRWRKRNPNMEPIPQTHEELRELSALRDASLESLKADLRAMLSPLPFGFDKMRNRGLRRLLKELPDSDSAAKDRIAAWISQDEPRYRRQARASERFANARMKIYERWAAEIAASYDTVIVEAPFAKHAVESTDKSPALHAADRNYQIAAPHSLVQKLSHACRRSGSRFVKKRSKDTTARCSVCGGKVATGPDLILVCENGHAQDQDYNAAVNLLSQSTAVSERKSRLRRRAVRRASQVAGDTTISEE